MYIVIKYIQFDDNIHNTVLILKAALPLPKGLGQLYIATVMHDFVFLFNGSKWTTKQGPLLLICFNFNPNMDK